MKNWMKLLTVGLLAFGLAACDDTADSKPGTDAEKKSDLTIEEVMNQAEKASEDLKSLHADMEIVQNISSDTEEMSFDMDITSKMDIVQEPLGIYQVMSMQMDLFGEMAMETEMYMTADGIYMKDPEEGTWNKIPMDDSEDLMDMMDASQDASVDYDSLKEFIDDFKFEQSNDEYILTLKASGDKFKKLIEDQLAEGAMMDLLNEEEADILDGMDINDIEYEIFIDKKTFHTTKFNLIMDTTMTAEGETVTIKQDVKAVLSKFNEIDEIVVPQEIIDNAVSY